MISSTVIMIIKNANLALLLQLSLFSLLSLRQTARYTKNEGFRYCCPAPVLLPSDSTMDACDCGLSFTDA